ncbi:MAG: hypothetical protein COA78_36040 [Blastopirellula sp.]|nr:MAG: hypothetical protein COA78_36040 [Blastopirellula sp.]
MAITTDKLLLFKSHECSNGLSDEALQEIADTAELVQVNTGDYLHRANQKLNSVYFVVHGRLKQSIVDMHGNVLLQHFLTRGTQFGALGAAQADPIPVDVVAVEPSAALRIDFDTTRKLSFKYDEFGANITKLIGSMVRRALLADRKPRKSSIVAIIHEPNTSRELTQRLLNRLLELEETPCLMSDQAGRKPSEKIAYRPLIEEDGQQISREDFRRQIGLWSNVGRIIIDVDSSISSENAALLFEFSDQIIWCCSYEQTELSIQKLKAIEEQAPGWKEKINLVWTLNKNHWVAPQVEEFRELVARDFKISFDEPEIEAGQGQLLIDGFERLVHHLRGVRIGLALGGGGARGMAHLGVLKALADHGIVIDAIAGTSAGAMAGIICASGYAPGYATELFANDLKPGWPFTWMPRGGHWYLLHKYRRGLFDPMLRKYLTNYTLEQLPLPVQSVTVDLVSGKPVVRTYGDAVRSILESINLPVFSSPLCHEGQALIDGGLVNNIPADVLINGGCNFVIAVSVTSRLKAEFANNHPQTPTQEMKSGTIFQTLLRSYLVQSVNMNSHGVQPADIVIEPDVSKYDLSEFSSTRELAALGEEAAVQSIPEIKALLHHVDSKLFPKL